MEYYKKCSVCGKIWSYTTEDIEKNKANATQGVISAIGSIASVFGGTRLDTYALNNAANNSLDKVIDYDKCPNCGSLKSVQITEDEARRSSNGLNNMFNVSSIDINKNASEETLLKRCALFLEDGEWERANYYCEQVLDINTENGYAYFYKLMAENQIDVEENFINCKNIIEINPLYKKIMRFADEDLKNKVSFYNEQIKEKVIREEEIQRENEYREAVRLYDIGCKNRNIIDLQNAYNKFIIINNYSYAQKYSNDCLIMISQLKKIEDKRDKRKDLKVVSILLFFLSVLVLFFMDYLIGLIIAIAAVIIIIYLLCVRIKEKNK